MQLTSALSPPPRTDAPAWTLADQISSYRFWGLVGMWVCSAFSMQALRTGVLGSAKQLLGYAEIAQLMAVALPTGMVAGLVLGLLLVRRGTVPGLLGLTLLAGVLLPLVLQQGWEPGLPSLAALLLLGQLQLYALMVVVPAVIAGGRGGGVAFASALVVALALKAAVDMGGPVLTLTLPERWPFWSPYCQSLAAMGLALVLLWPVWRSQARDLFTGVPPLRHAAHGRQASMQALHPRNPLGMALWVGLLWVAVLIPLLGLWVELAQGLDDGLPLWWTRVAQGCAVAGVAGLVVWNYRIHRDVLALAAPAQRAELLTPRAAAWACVLVPLSGLLLPLQLAQVLNLSGRGRLSTAWLVLWCLLLPPVAVAQVQRAVNRAIAEMAAPVTPGQGA